jgi:glycosyltransferase involved in cell wall biosynthesis
MTIVHISTDFPDSFAPAKTRAIANLLELTGERFDHAVYSLNRVAPSPINLATAMVRNPLRPRLPVTLAERTAEMATLIYQAPPKGLYLRALLDRVADWIADDIVRSNLRPTLIHGHKLSMEGIVAERVARRLKRPYALSIQGNSDRSILSARLDLTRLYRRIFHGAAVVFPFSPWALDFVEGRLGKRSGATILLPCATPADAIAAPVLVEPRLMSAFHLANHQLKNAGALIAASRMLQDEIPGYSLDIVGGGSDRDREALERDISAVGARSASLAGPVAHDAIQARMNRSAGFVMISRRESFGLVFVEALLAGCPVAFPRGWAIDGYFDDMPFAIPVPAGDGDAIADAMRRLVRDQSGLKAALSRWQQSGAARAFQRPAIAAAYGDGLAAAIAA